MSATVYDERTQPADALVARMWFLLLRHCDSFTIYADGEEVVVEMRGTEHRVPKSPEGLAQIREIARDPRGARPKVPSGKLPRARAATLAAVTGEWQRTEAIATAMSSTASAAIYHLTELHKAGHIKRRVNGRRFSWRRAQDV